ncbi:MAG TPA: fibronectin type III domain-containing protein [Solirubrobacterales bacterium]|nr:fibronectin type III domain-containing protein [Solirubrobacterales bacterium]
MSRRTIQRATLALASVLGALAIFSPAAFASGAPIISINPTQELGLNAGFIRGTVDPNGAPSATYSIQYGKLKFYGRVTGGSVKGTGALPIEARVFGLEPRTTYQYKITATNEFGTSEATGIFETLLSWKVEGTRVEDLTSLANFKDTFAGKAGEGGYLELRGKILGIWTRVYCHQSASASGILNVSGPVFVFNNCFMQLNGVKNPNCNSKGSVRLSMNAFMAQNEPAKITSTEECPVGQIINLTEGGLTPEIGGTEAVEQKNFSLYGSTLASGQPFEVDLAVGTSISPGGWKMAEETAYEGKKFGIS